MATYLVTGGEGFIGKHLVQRLLEDNHSVIVLDDYSSAPCRSDLGPNLEIYEGSILDQNLVNYLTDRSDGVFHLAGISSIERSFREPNACHQVNFVGATLVARAAKRNGVRFIFSSSAAVYGDARDHSDSISTELTPCSPYGKDKLSVEEFMLDNEIGGLALRYFNVFGPGQTNSEFAGVITKFISCAIQSETLTIYGEGLQQRDFVFVEDIVTANILAMRAEAVGTALNIGTGIPTSILKLGQVVLKVCRSDSQIVHVVSKSSGVPYSCTSTEKAFDTIGFKSKISLEEGLIRIAASLMEQ